jgi:hypothetical protein
VGVETIKALWADVHFEGAEMGLIATTSAVSRDGQKLCEVRKWPMSFAEADVDGSANIDILGRVERPSQAEAGIVDEKRPTSIS